MVMQMNNTYFEEAELKRKFEVFSLIGTIFVTIGIVKFIEKIPLEEDIIALFLILIGGFIFLMGTNKHFAKLFIRRR